MLQEQVLFFRSIRDVVSQDRMTRFLGKNDQTGETGRYDNFDLEQAIEKAYGRISTDETPTLAVAVSFGTKLTVITDGTSRTIINSAGAPTFTEAFDFPYYRNRKYNFIVESITGRGGEVTLLPDLVDAYGRDPKKIILGEVRSYGEQEIANLKKQLGTNSVTIFVNNNVSVHMTSGRSSLSILSSRNYGGDFLLIEDIGNTSYNFFFPRRRSNNNVSINLPSRPIENFTVTDEQICVTYYNLLIIIIILFVIYYLFSK